MENVHGYPSFPMGVLHGSLLRFENSGFEFLSRHLLYGCFLFYLLLYFKYFFVFKVLHSYENFCEMFHTLYLKILKNQL